MMGRLSRTLVLKTRCSIEVSEKGVRITPDVMASGGGNGDSAGKLGTLLLPNLFRDQMKPANPKAEPVNGTAKQQ